MVVRAVDWVVDEEVNSTIAQCLTEWGAERLTGWLTGWLTKNWLRGCFRLPGG